MVCKIPIDVVPGSSPPRFAWRQVIEGLDGERKVIDQEGALHPSVEKPVSDLIALTKSLMRDNAMLQGQADSMGDRIVAQSELLAKHAEKSAQAAAPARKPTKG